ncbi:MAG: hypothetical protein FWD95_16610, partial [Nocardioidaceae bacterium]|nr:hypothetical protein [Nocardioidaceae bacterium]
GNPYRDWHVTIRATAIDKAYPSIGAFQRLAFVKRDGHGSWGGRVITMRVVGSKKTVTVSGDAFRIALGLRSTWFHLA